MGTKRWLLNLVAIIALLHIQVIPKAQKITDTIFFNSRWQICEKPIAVYYRIGTLNIDSFWYYTGKIKDFDLSGTLLTEAEYSDDGKRDGLFNFYYPDGKLMLSGKYWQGLMIGDWHWYYSNDSLKAIINFDGPSDDFSVVRYKLPNGTTTLLNGTGKFEWYTNPYFSGWTNLKVHGSFADGKRSGGWKYYSEYQGEESFRFEETYDKQGNFKKSVASGNYFGIDTRGRFTDYIFIPPKMLITEQIQYDNFFRKDSAGGTALLNYLLNRKSSEIIVSNKKVENVLLHMMRSLESNRSRIDYRQKDIDGSIEFKIGEKGYPEDITINGKGITEKEKEFILYLLEKFRDIEMPEIESVSIERYYTIYLYSVDLKEYMPAAIRDKVGIDIFFSTMQKEKFLALLKENKKKIKKYVREEYQYYW